MVNQTTATKKQLTVIHGDKGVVLNKFLLNKQNAWKNLSKIKDLHRTRLMIDEAMESTDDSSILKALDKAYDEVEFALQEMWGFEKDAKHHRFWERPKCTCPKMDNSDSYPSGRYVINGECPLHAE